MQRLMHIVRLFKEYVILALLTVTSLVLLSLNDNPQIRTIRAYTIGLIGLLQDAASVVPNVFALEREIELLRQQNVALTDEVSRLREARLENARLRSMLQLKEHSQFKLVAADVVGKSVDLLRNTITLNVGEKDGISVNMPVVSESGLVGRVIATSGSYTIAQLMINRDFRASARIQRSRVEGILAWMGGDIAELRNVAKTQDVVEGDVVITSEYSSIFPRDLRVGIVTSVTQREGSLFRQIHIRPAVDFSTLEHVFVVVIMPSAERQAIEKKAAQ